MVTDPEELSLDEERKLIGIPRCGVELRVELRWFEEERGCAVERILVPDGGTLIRVAGLVQQTRMEMDVVLKEEVREGHVVLAGGR